MVDVNKLCHHKFLEWFSTTPSSLLNSHNATMQLCTDNTHKKWPTFGIQQLHHSLSRWPWLAYCKWKRWRYSEQMVTSCHKNWLKFRWSSPSRKMTQEHPELENLDGFRFEVDVCLSWTFIVTQNKGHSGLADF